jgi:hypothetical protein
MLTKRREGNVTHHDHLVVVRLEGHAKMLTGVLFESLEEFAVHLCDTPRGVHEAFTRGVLANRLE